MRNPVSALLVLTLLISTAAGCTAEPPPAPSGAASLPVPAGSLPAEVISEITGRLPLADGYVQPQIEFADRDHGYAMATRCRPEECDRRVYATADGGRHWRELDAPFPTAKNHQMYVGDARSMILLAEPHSWLVTRDGGASFQRLPYDQASVPAAYNVILKVRDDGATAGPGGALWKVDYEGGGVTTQRSPDGGRTWQDVAVPAQPGRPVAVGWLQFSADGRDTWLTVYQEALGTGGGTSVMRASVRKQTGPPLVWQLREGRWEPRPLPELKDSTMAQYSTAAAGAGVLAVSGPDGVAYLSDGYRLTTGLPRMGWITMLADGTLLGRPDQANEVYLAIGTGARREWSRVAVA